MDFTIIARRRAACAPTTALSSLLFGLILSLMGACSSPDASKNALNSQGEAPPRVAVTASRAGTIYRQDIPVAKTGDTMVVQVFEPTQLEAGKTYPLVLQGHGYGGSRNKTPDAFIQRLMDRGYYVISIDQRGFGQSSGTVRVMSPDFEGQDLIAILDWAEDLPGLRRRTNGEMMVGSYGGSYGGMYQLLLSAADPKHRLRVMAPDITPHDLTYALDPNNVVKSGWGLALVAGGELPLISLLTGSGSPLEIVNSIVQIAANGHLRQDRALYDTVITAALTNQFPEPGYNFLRYHSVRYFCDGEPPLPQNFVFATPDPLQVAPDAPPPADVLLTQGFRDTLFNFNDGLRNYECLKARGGDVRLLTHQSGHILPLELGSDLESVLDPFYAALTLPQFQDAGGTRRCGALNLDDVQFAWFEEKLRNQAGAVDAVLTTGDKICLSLGEDDAIAVDHVKRGGTRYTIDDSTPQLNSLLGVVGSLLGTIARDALLANQPLFTVPAGGAVLAGVPLLNVTFEGLSGFEQTNCATLVQLGCDPILFIGLGRRAATETQWHLIDDQLTPVRGFGAHTLEMTGVAERLNAGDEVALLIYAFHAQYPITWSRDLLVPALKISGNLELPLLSNTDIAADGV